MSHLTDALRGRHAWIVWPLLVATGLACVVLATTDEPPDPTIALDAFYDAVAIGDAEAEVIELAESMKLPVRQLSAGAHGTRYQIDLGFLEDVYLEFDADRRLKSKHRF